MRTCETCGTSGLTDTANFCSTCGSAVSVEPACAACGSENVPGARFCSNCGAAQAAGNAPARSLPTPPTETAPGRGSARRITSVLFGDLVGFTTLSESRDPEEVRDLLTAYFEECRRIVGRYGGQLEKFIGDAVMAVWGIPVTREDDAERAVRAGLELVEAVTALGDRIDMHGLSMRVGITTAEVAVTVGAAGQGMVAGDPVNTAARIQSTAAPGEVWVDETTKVFSHSAIAYADAGAHTMKGKAAPVPLWKVKAVVAGSGGDRRDDGLEGQLVGRDRELRLIKEFFHQVQETHRPGLVVVDGEPGVGKSRLAWEFEKYVDGFDADVLWHSGRCLSYGDGVAYYALAEAVRGRLTILADSGEDVDADGRGQLKRALAACVPDETERSWLEPRVAALLGMESGASFRREELFVAWTLFFKYVGLWRAQSDRPAPVVLVIDDAQYADEGLLAFLEHLLAAADFPVFVLVLARPELFADHPTLIGNRRITAVHLEPLTATDMGMLLDRLVVGVPDKLRAELVERAEGIPLYAIETVRSLVDQDLVVPREGVYVLADPESVDLSALTAPASLQALIAARLDTLPAAERAVVDRASVLGLVFTDSGITALCHDVPGLQDAVAGLVRREVLRRESDRLSNDFGNFRFVQGAVRQVAYGMLSRRDRKATHLDVAHALEAELASADGAGDELTPIIAQHYLEAIDAVPADPDVPELTRAASDHLERAADRAAALGAPGEAASHLEKALSRCEPDRRLSIQAKLARQLRLSASYAAAIEHAQAAVDGFGAQGDLAAAALAAEDLARSVAYREGGDAAPVEALVRSLLERIEDVHDTLKVRHALIVSLQNLMLSRGAATEEMLAMATVSSRLAERIGEPAYVAGGFTDVALATLFSGRPKLATALYEWVAEYAAQHRAFRPHMIALQNLASIVANEDLPRAIQYGSDAVAATRKIGDTHGMAIAQLNLVIALAFAGEWDDSLQTAADDVHRSLGLEIDLCQRLVAWARGEAWPAVADPVDGDVETMDLVERRIYLLDRAVEAQAEASGEAVGFALDAVHDAAGPGVGVEEFVFCWMHASDIVRRAGSRADVERMLDLVDDAHGPWPMAVLAQRARLNAVLGEDGSLPPAEVEGLYRDALEAVRSWGSVPFEAHICVDLGRWLLRQGRAEEGNELLGTARDLYGGLGAARWIEALAAEGAGVV